MYCYSCIRVFALRWGHSHMKCSKCNNIWLRVVCCTQLFWRKVRCDYFEMGYSSGGEWAKFFRSSSFMPLVCALVQFRFHFSDTLELNSLICEALDTLWKPSYQSWAFSFLSAASVEHSRRRFRQSIRPYWRCMTYRLAQQWRSFIINNGVDFLTKRATAGQCGPVAAQIVYSTIHSQRPTKWIRVLRMSVGQYHRRRRLLGWAVQDPGNIWPQRAAYTAGPGNI